MAAAVPVIAVVGASGSGKTPLMEALIAELARRGYRVGAIKHSHCGFELDIPGKDTWRYSRAGAAGVAISGPGQVGVVRRVEEELTAEEVAALLPGVDLVLAEGFGDSPWPKVEVRGGGTREAGAGGAPGREYGNVVAVVSQEGAEPLVETGQDGEMTGLGRQAAEGWELNAGSSEATVTAPPVFARGQLKALADFVESGWLRTSGE